MRSRHAVTIVMFLLVLLAASANAQFNRTAVSVTGLDANSCTTTSPCRTFNRAISQTNAGGEVLALDSGGYGPFTVEKDITVMAVPGAYAGITASIAGSDGIRIDYGGVKIILRNLFLTGLGASNGINILFAQADVAVENCVITGFNDNGIRLDFFTEGNLFVTDTTVRYNGVSGIVAAGNMRVAIDRCRLERNDGEALLIVGTTNVTVRDTFAARNGNGFVLDAFDASLDVEDSVSVNNIGAGFVVRTGGGLQNMNLERCRASGNAKGILAGVLSNVAPGIVRVSNSAITNNATGVEQVGAGSILSRLNNTLEQNTSGNTFPGTFLAK